MKKSATHWVILSLLLMVGMAVKAGEPLRVMRTETAQRHGWSVPNPATRSDRTGHKATRDTLLIMGPWGSGAQYNGQFQDPTGNPAWNGWTHVDGTQVTDMHWQVSDFQAANLGSLPSPENLAAWCGSLEFESCGPQDLEGGYGNLWNEELRWTATVPDPGSPVTVHFSAYINVDTEPGYDYVRIRLLTPGGSVDLAVLDGILQNEFLQYDFTLQPLDFWGDNADEVVLQITFESDVAWSDKDCLWPTAGALQVDDITVMLEQEAWSFESVSDFQEDFGDWAPTFPNSVGDFTQLWTSLDDLDPCATNFSPQVAFIDDGEMVPGVGPTYCLDWCYGPAGYIVNTTGGQATPDMGIWNTIRSPVMELPPGDGAVGIGFDFTCYEHTPLGPDYSGIFLDWGIRFADTVDEFGNPTGNTIEDASWHNQGPFYGGPEYYRYRYLIDWVFSGSDVFQVQMGARWYAWTGFTGQNGTPAPYLDNVRISVFDRYGPIYGFFSPYFSAQDNFPAIGEVDLVNLGNNSVRFDPGSSWIDNDTGQLVNRDQFRFSAGPQRSGAELQGHPRIHFLIKQNPLFDPYRTNPEFGTSPSGFVVADTARNPDGTAISGTWEFDLPDSNFLFPGDIIHYFVEVADGGGPGGLEIQTITIPEDTTGFSDFSDIRRYSSYQGMYALPSVYENPSDPGVLKTPPLLFWNDGGTANWNEWLGALKNLGFVHGEDYDVYFSSHSGLGGRATPYSLLGYQNLIYGCGAASAATLTGADSTNDVELLDSWLRLGNRNLLLTGNNLVSDMLESGGPLSIQFVEEWMKVNLINNNLRPLIENQAAPLVRPLAGNGVFLEDLRWIAYGGCPDILAFDAVEANTGEGGIRLAEFLNPSGSGIYSYSAATLYQNQDFGSQVLTIPYDLGYIHTPMGGGKTSAHPAARTRVLEQVLALFGIEGDPLDVSAAPEVGHFSVRSFPNPFNPVVKIEYTLPRPGHLSLKVYDLRGLLVRTLIDEVKQTEGFVIWDGTDDRGAQAASGVYFYEARREGEVKVDKIVMIK